MHLACRRIFVFARQNSIGSDMMRDMTCAGRCVPAARCAAKDRKRIRARGRDFPVFYGQSNKANQAARENRRAESGILPYEKEYII